MVRSPLVVVLAMVLSACVVAAEHDITVNDGTADLLFVTEVQTPFPVGDLSSDPDAAADLGIEDMDQEIEDAEVALAQLADEVGAQDWSLIVPDENGLRFGFELIDVPFENVGEVYAADLGDDGMASEDPLQDVALTEQNGEVSFIATLPAVDTVFDPAEFDSDTPQPVEQPEDVDVPEPPADAGDPFAGEELSEEELEELDAAFQELEDAFAEFEDAEGAPEDAPTDETETEDPFAEADDPFGDFEQALDFDVTMSLTLAMPGEVIDHNADRVEEPGEEGHTRLMWDAGEEPREVHAVSDVGGGLPLLWLGLVGAAAVLLALIVGGLLLKRSRKSQGLEGAPKPDMPSPTPVG